MGRPICPHSAEASTFMGQPDGRAGAATYDHRQALQRAAGREEVARELFFVLARSLPESRRRIDRATADDDREALHSAAHSLKGAVAYCGVPRLEQAVLSVERLAATGSRAEIAAAVAELGAAVEELLGYAAEHGSANPAESP